MNEDLTPKELAAVKKAARSRRISNIRRRVTIFAATLMAVFSGVVLVRSQTGQPATNAAATTTIAQAPAQTAPEEHSDDDSDDDDEGEDEDRDDDGDLGSAIAGAAIDAASQALGVDSGNSSTSAPTTTDQAPLTTSQS